MMGYTIDGGFGEYAVAFARYVVKVPEGVDTLDPSARLKLSVERRAAQ